MGLVAYGDDLISYGESLEQVKHELNYVATLVIIMAGILLNHQQSASQFQSYM